MHAKLSHVSGDYWTMYFADVAGEPIAATSAQFKIGVDGKVSGLDMTYSPFESPNSWPIFLKRA
jgi:hypothetical protein